MTHFHFLSPRARLALLRDPYDLEGSSPLFLQAVRENIRWHQRRCPGYRQILQARGFCPDAVRTEEDLWRIPVLPTLYLKRHPLLSIPKEQIRWIATSSGTGGAKTRVAFDTSSLACLGAMGRRLLSCHGVFSPVPALYLILGYEPFRGVSAGAIQTAFGATFTAPAAGRVYALKRNGLGGWDINLKGLLDALSSWKQGGARLPLRLVGFPSYLYFLARCLKEKKIRLPSHPLSCVLMSGGWKGFAQMEPSPEVLCSLIGEVFHIPRERIFEFFCASEHNVLYRRCPQGHFHVPAYSRVIIRDPVTMEPLPPGQTGLLSFVFPLITSMPLISVMTDDMAVLLDSPGKGGCGCGLKTPAFDLAGRAASQAIKTCAAQAAELWEGGMKR